MEMHIECDYRKLIIRLGIISSSLLLHVYVCSHVSRQIETRNYVANDQPNSIDILACTSNGNRWNNRQDLFIKMRFPEVCLLIVVGSGGRIFTIVVVNWMKADATSFSSLSGFGMHFGEVLVVASNTYI